MREAHRIYICNAATKQHYPFEVDMLFSALCVIITLCDSTFHHVLPLISNYLFLPTPPYYSSLLLPLSLLLLPLSLPPYSFLSPYSSYPPLSPSLQVVSGCSLLRDALRQAPFLSQDTEGIGPQDPLGEDHVSLVPHCIRTQPTQGHAGEGSVSAVCVLVMCMCVLHVCHSVMFCSAVQCVTALSVRLHLSVRYLYLQLLGPCTMPHTDLPMHVIFLSCPYFTHLFIHTTPIPPRILSLSRSNKRLGAARGTMFCIGGVAALKRHPFFEDLDWTDLINLRISPPIDLSIPYVTPTTPHTPTQNTAKPSNKGSDLPSPCSPMPKDTETDSDGCAINPNGPPAPQQLALTMEHLTRHFHEEFTGKHISLSDVEENNSTSSLAGNSSLPSPPLHLIPSTRPFICYCFHSLHRHTLSLSLSLSQAASLL